MSRWDLGDLHRVVLRVEHHVLLPHQVGGLPVLLTDIVSSQVDPDSLGGSSALVHQAVRRRDDVSALSSCTHCCTNDGSLIMKMLAMDLLTLDLEPSRHNAALPRCDPPPPSTPGMHIQCISKQNSKEQKMLKHKMYRKLHLSKVRLLRTIYALHTLTSSV